MSRTERPTKEQLSGARGKKVADLIDYNLKVLFCGINPGLYSAAVGHHFARPGNRFWPVLYQSGFTNSILLPCEEKELLHRGYGITNLVSRATASADELTKDELKEGMIELRKKVLRYQPCVLAILGVVAFRLAFNHSKAMPGLQKEKINTTYLWVLPNPSGINASYQIKDLVELFRVLRSWVESGRG